MPTADHPTYTALAAFRRGQGIPPDEVPALIQHLAGCSACRAKQNRRPTPDETDAAWERAMARISPEDIARRSARAQNDLPLLLGKLGVEEPVLDPAQVSTALITELLQEVWKLRFSDSPRCLLVCELAVRVADQLTQPAVSRRLAASARLRAHCALANAQRLRGDYAAAHASLSHAPGLASPSPWATRLIAPNSTP